MKRLFTVLIFTLCSISALAQDKKQVSQTMVNSPGGVQSAGDGKPEAPKAADGPIAAKADTKLPPHATLTAEETSKIRIRQLRVEKLSAQRVALNSQFAALKAQLEKIEAQLDAESKTLRSEWVDVIGKYGIPADKVDAEYDVINADSDSERPILLKKKAKAEDKAPPK